MDTLKVIAPLDSSVQSEPDIEATVSTLLRSLGYDIKFRKIGIKDIDRNWPSKNVGADGHKPGEPDLLLCIPGSQKPVCVWENKSRTENVLTALQEAQFYIKGLHAHLPGEPALPRLAVGFNGAELVLSYFTQEGTWTPLKASGSLIKDAFPVADFLRNGISAEGILTSFAGAATTKDLRAALWDLKTLYRNIPPLASRDRRQIDFTIALLTIRLLVEQHPDWGTWAEQPALQLGAPDRDHKIAERFIILTDRILANRDLKERYGNIFEFKEREGSHDVSFDFKATLREIPRDKNHFTELFKILDRLPPLLHADFDIFGEVYQNIGDEATKKALGEFFTGRHIIAGVLPVFFNRAGWDRGFQSVQSKKIADIACGTGGFLTETLRLVRKLYGLKQEEIKRFAQETFYGFDLGYANASRARVNMYFAGDGFSVIKGGTDSLDDHFLNHEVPQEGFDAILTNPPYGDSSYGRYEEAFIYRAIRCLKPGEGWGLIVLPAGTLENPRSQKIRFTLLKHAKVTDVIALPRHAFAPYTQQRTTIVIFNKRKAPLSVADNDWETLLDIVGHERTAMFIVDNDGYANSDKRYPTERQDSEGRWLHNDLQSWLDKNGVQQPSKLYRALIDEIDPPEGTDEFGTPLKRQYGVFRIKHLFVEDSGVVLLPDVFLRRDTKLIDMQTYVQECERILNSIKGLPDIELERPVADDIKKLLSFPLTYDKNIMTVSCPLEDIFVIRKGDHGLTEESIYQYFDADGFPVYGGGADYKYKISRFAKTKHGKPVTIFTGPAIIISMDGTSGSMRVIESGDFCLNHHGCVLIPFDTSIDLHWFVQQNEQFLKALASNQESSATLTMKKLKDFKVRIPVPKDIRQQVGSLRKKLVTLQKNLLSSD